MSESFNPDKFWISELNLFNNENYMQVGSTTAIAGQIVAYILQQTRQQIKSRGLISYLPQFLVGQSSQLLAQIMFAASPDPEQSHRRGLAEQTNQSIIKIPKDSLTPKQLQLELIDNNIAQKSVSPSQSSCLKASKLGRGSSLRNSNYRSISLTEKKSLKQPNTNENQFRSIDLGVEEDPEVRKMRQKTEIRLQEAFGVQKYREKREKLATEKLQKFKNEINEADFTFDYEGDSIKAQTADDKLKYYALRAGLGQISRRLKSSFQAGQISSDVKKQQKFRLGERNNQKSYTPTEMPLFPMGMHKFDPTEANKFKLLQYRKHFGNKYTRLDRNSQTIQVIREQKKDDVFGGEKKHLRDSQPLNQSMVSNSSRSHLRKLALPRLNGRYKVLDRYEQF